MGAYLIRHPFFTKSPLFSAEKAPFQIVSHDLKCILMNHPAGYADIMSHCAQAFNQNGGKKYDDK